MSKFGIIVDGIFQEAPATLNINKRKIYNPREEHYIAAGYFPIIEKEKPLERKIFNPKYYFENNTIIKDWEMLDIPVESEKELTVEERIVVLEKELEELKNQL